MSDRLLAFAIIVALKTGFMFWGCWVLARQFNVDPWSLAYGVTLLAIGLTLTLGHKDG